MKKYWWALALTVAFVLFLVLGKGTDSITQLLFEKNKQAEAELKALEKQASDLKKEQDENLEKYLKTVEELEDKYEKGETKIKNKTKKKIKEFIEDFEEDPEEIAKRIAEENGWEYIK